MTKRQRVFVWLFFVTMAVIGIWRWGCKDKTNPADKPNVTVTGPRQFYIDRLDPGESVTIEVPIFYVEPNETY